MCPSISPSKLSMTAPLPQTTATTRHISSLWCLTQWFSTAASREHIKSSPTTRIRARPHKVCSSFVVFRNHHTTQCSHRHCPLARHSYSITALLRRPGTMFRGSRPPIRIRLLSATKPKVRPSVFLFFLFVLLLIHCVLQTRLVHGRWTTTAPRCPLLSRPCSTLLGYVACASCFFPLRTDVKLRS